MRKGSTSLGHPALGFILTAPSLPFRAVWIPTNGTVRIATEQAGTGYFFRTAGPVPLRKSLRREHVEPYATHQCSQSGFTTRDQLSFIISRPPGRSPGRHPAYQGNLRMRGGLKFFDTANAASIIAVIALKAPGHTQRRLRYAHLESCVFQRSRWTPASDAGQCP